jgi:hypothetical protein
MANVKKNGGTNFVNYIYQNCLMIITAVVILTLIVFSYLLYSQPRIAEIVPLINADHNVLKSAFFGESPHLFYCHERGNRGYVPPKLLEAQKILQSKYSIGILNCSQELPSGKTIFNRFKLKSDWKPTIFTTVPWSRPAQIPPLSLKEAKTIASFIESSVTPKAQKANTDKEFKDNCGFFSGNRSESRAEEHDSLSTCVVLVQGTKYADGHESLVSNIVTKYYKQRIVMVNAQSRRFSFERTHPGPSPSTYALRVVAVRNGTHFLRMTETPTWTNIQYFVDNAIKVSKYLKYPPLPLFFPSSLSLSYFLSSSSKGPS